MWMDFVFVYHLGTLFLFKIYLPDLEKARTVAFTSLVVFQIVRLQVVRMNYKVGIFSNKHLVLAVILSMFLQLFVVYVPFMQTAFKTVNLSFIDWVYIIAISSTVLIFGQIVKLIYNIKEKFFRRIILP